MPDDISLKDQDGVTKGIYCMLICFYLNVQHLGLCTLCAGVKYFEVFLQKLRGKNCLLFFFFSFQKYLKFNLSLRALSP